MPELKRNFFGAYYSADPERPRIFHGIEVYHAVDCGRYIDTDGTPKDLMHYTLCKDDLPDTQGRNCEMCDFSLAGADPDAMPPIIPAILSGDASAIESSLSALAPIVRMLVESDLYAGMSAWEIAELRAGVIVPEFLGFTFAAVLSWRSDIYQPTVDEDGNESPNVQRCSLESE